VPDSFTGARARASLSQAERCPAMRFTTKIVVLFSGVLALATISAALVVLGGQQARHSLDRMDLVHRSYEAHLALSNHTYQLFKQFGDAMTIGDLDRGAMEADLLRSIRGDISLIRETLVAELQLFGDDRKADLEHLAKIETKINKLLSEYQVVIDAGIPESADDWARLSRILDERVDQDFARLIQTGLDRQYGALLYQRSMNQERLKFSQFLSIAVALTGTIVASIALWWIIRSFNKPVNQLIDGAEAFAGGERHRRIVLEGGGELDGVAQAFNRMADEISARQEALESANEQLETTVASRTAELERLLATLREAEESRKRLLMDVSHELRTPLTIIRGEADIALRGNGKPIAEYRDALERCREAAIHTSRLVDDLLFIARRQSQEARLNLMNVDLATFIPKVLEDCQGIWGDQETTVTFTSELGKAETRADPDRLRQVLLILLDNAHRYGGTRIDLTLGRGIDGFQVDVRDDGPGLGADDLARVFDRFYRGQNATRRYDAGIGLGLPVAKAIVEAHGGMISVASEPGDGLTARFLLPDQASSQVAA
jgi:two-component system OmpR family sensor kinase